MPLLDHFQPPLSEERHWGSFHAAWLGSLADDLNQRLPKGFFAEEQLHQGGVEIDVATMEASHHAGNGSSPADWWPMPPVVTIPAVFSDEFEVRIFSTAAGPQLLAAIELVSPRNKDRPAARRAFGVKCASYLNQGIGLIVVDIITERHANLHNEIVA